MSTTYTAYFDESHTGSVYAVAGFLAADEEWRSFSNEWNAVLGDYRLDHFHMREYNHSTGQFESWRGDTKRRTSLMKDLTYLVGQRVRFSVGCAVWLDDFESLVTEPEMKQVFGSPYSAASQICLIRTGRWARGFSHDSPISRIFDRGNSRRSEFQNEYQRYWDDPQLREAYRLGRLDFADDKLAIPLQAADIVVYEIAKGLTEIRNETGRPLRQSFRKLLQLPHDWTFLDSPTMRAIASMHRSYPKRVG